MKKIPQICALFFLLFSSATAQTTLNKLSVEGGVGYTGAMQPYLTRYKSNFSGFTHFDLGVRYMINEYYGVKVSFASDRFENDPGGKIGTDMQRYSVEGVVNVGKFFDLTYRTRDHFGLLAHAGVGFATLKPFLAPKAERVGPISIGITPQYRLSDKVALYSDFTLFANVKQHYRFDGSLIQEPYKTPTIGHYYNFSVGLIFYLGEGRYHSDWY